MYFSSLEDASISTGLEPSFSKVDLKFTFSLVTVLSAFSFPCAAEIFDGVF